MIRIANRTTFEKWLQFTLDGERMFGLTTEKTSYNNRTTFLQDYKTGFYD